jgi:esterase
MDFRSYGRVCLLIVAVMTACTRISSTPQPKLPEGVKTAWVNGYAMAYVDRGQGDVILLVHGAQNDYRYWQPQLETLAADHRVISVSLRHHFPEAWKGEGEDYSAIQHSKDLAAFIGWLDVGAVDLVGHSRGGSIVTLTTIAHPELVRKLVLVEPVLLSLVPTAAGATSEDPRIARAKVVADLFKAGEIDKALELFTDQVSGPGTWQSRPEIERQFARDNAWTVTRQLSDVEQVGCAGFASLVPPVLVMVSERVPKLLSRIAEAAHRCLPSSKTVTIPDAGHRLNRDNPAAFNRALIDFLR